MTVEHFQSFLRDIDQVCMFCKSLFSFSTFSFGYCIILSVFFSIDTKGQKYEKLLENQHEPLQKPDASEGSVLPFMGHVIYSS
jgi:hypothetical protein